VGDGRALHHCSFSLTQSNLGSETRSGPWVVTVLIWAIGLSLGGPTGYAINPARDLGPRIADALLPIPGKRDSDFAYGWIPVVGPIIGGIIGALLYAATFGSAPAPH
jgi:glycerol uptake facilitator protein